MEGNTSWECSVGSARRASVACVVVPGFGCVTFFEQFSFDSCIDYVMLCSYYFVHSCIVCCAFLFLMLKPETDEKVVVNFYFFHCLLLFPLLTFPATFCICIVPPVFLFLYLFLLCCECFWKADFYEIETSSSNVWCAARYARCI